MGPYLFANAALAGFFLFGAIYHFILWGHDRRNRTLLFFAVVTLFASGNSFIVLTIATTRSIDAAQRALDVRGALAIISLVFVAWLISSVTGVRARMFLWAITVSYAVLLVLTLYMPLAGVVTGVEQVISPWGESLSALRREHANPFLWPAYLGALTVPAFGLYAASRLWRSHDGIGSVLTAFTSLGYLSSVLAGFAIDTNRVSLPYMGPLVTAIWVLPIALQVARANQQQARKLFVTERRFRFLVQNQTEFVVSCRADGTLTFVNDSYCRFFGVTSDEIMGRSLVERFAEEHREPMLRHLADVARGQAALTGEHVVAAKGGEQRWTQWTTSGAFGAQGDLIALQLTGRDIHDRVQAEQAKRKLEQQLLQAQKMEALGQLAGGVAHDFNNLLTVIAGHTDMLLSDNSDMPARHDLEQIRQASDRAASMTRQLLAFSRQSVLEPKVVNLNSVVAQMEAMLRRSIGEDIALIVRAAPDARSVKADPDQLGRALLNMAINARDAMPDGGTLVIETRNVVMPNDGNGSEPREFVLLAMSDTGPGMTPETKSRLFEPFYTTKGQGKGTGLGLAVVDGIVKQSGGRIDVYSEQGVGTTFKVYLPATDTQARAEDPPSDGRPPRGHETVLLVEDEPAVREMTQAALQRHGYTVLPAANGSEALRIAQANRGLINVVLTDVVMPGMSGRQLVDRLREELPSLPALFMSGYTSDAVLRHGIETGEADFLQKPFSTSALAAKLRQVLDR